METTKSFNQRILLIGINFAPELTGIGKYTGEMADWLVDKGYQCTAVTAFPYYPNWKIQQPYTGTRYKKEVKRNGNLTVYRCPLYVPAIPTGGRRVLQEITFFLSSFLVILRLLFKKGNHRIFCMAPPFHLGFLALFYRFFKGGEIIYHIHDLQIEAARDLKVLKADRSFRFLFALERSILRRVNLVSTVSPGMQRLIEKKVDKEIIYFPNWVDTHFLSPVKDQRALKEKWGFEADQKVVLYSGSIGEKQGLESLLDVAANLSVHPSIRFVICGNGPYKEKLMQMAAARKLSNVSFLPLQPLASFNSFLNMADVHLVIQRREACELMLPSKLTAILSVGGMALVTAEPGTTLYNTMKQYDMGMVIDCEDDTLLEKAILECCTTDYTSARLNSRTYAENYLSKDTILNKIMKKFDEDHDLESPFVLEELKVEKAS